MTRFLLRQGEPGTSQYITMIWYATNTHISLITVLSGSQQIYCSIGIWRHSAIFSVDFRLCYNIQGGEVRFIKMVSVNQGINKLQLVAKWHSLPRQSGAQHSSVVYTFFLYGIPGHLIKNSKTGRWTDTQCKIFFHGTQQYSKQHVTLPVTFSWAFFFKLYTTTSSGK